MRHNPWDLLVLQHIITFPEDLWFPFLSPNLYLSNKSCLSCGSFFLFYLSSSFSLPELLLHLSCLQHSNHRTWSRSQTPRIIKVKQRYTVIFCSRTNSSIILRISKPCGICICMATRLVEVCNVVAVTFIAASAAAIAHYHHQKKNQISRSWAPVALTMVLPRNTSGNRTRKCAHVLKMLLKVWPSSVWDASKQSVFTVSTPPSG